MGFQTHGQQGDFALLETGSRLVPSWMPPAEPASRAVAMARARRTGIGRLRLPPEIKFLDDVPASTATS